MLKVSKHKFPLGLIKPVEYAINIKNMLSKNHPLALDKMSDIPFFIVGCGRSGNTLLRSMLCAGGDVVIPPESYVIPRLIRRFQAYNYLPWDVLSSVIIGEFITYKEFYTWDLDLTPVYAKARDLSIKLRTLGNLIDLVYKEYAISQGKDGIRWADKTPINSLYVDKIHKVFPKAKFVHLVRDPRATSLSYVKSGLKGDLREAAKFWLESNTQIEKLKREIPDQFTFVKYEDLVTTPEKELRVLCEHLNLPFKDVMLEHWKNNEAKGDTNIHRHHANVLNAVNTNSINKWKKEINKMDIEVINEMSCLQTKFKKYRYV